MDELYDIKEQIRSFIVKTSYLPEGNVKDETLIFAQGMMDSMGFISLINFLEDTFSLKANDNDLVETNFESVNAMADFVVKKLNAEKVLLAN